MEITKTMEWDMGHRIPNHKSQCRNLHGHRYKVEITVKGELTTQSGKSSQGMVLDFSDIKVLLMEEIHAVCDHGFMYWEGDQEMNSFFSSNPDFKSIKVNFIPTAEEISQWIYNRLASKLSEKFRKKLVLSKVQLWETPTSSASFSAKK